MHADPHGREAGHVPEVAHDPQPEADGQRRVLGAQHDAVAERVDLLRAVLGQQRAHLAVEAERDGAAVVAPAGGERRETAERRLRREALGRFARMAVAVTSEPTRLLHDAREATLALVAPIDAGDMARVHDPLMSPLVWDLGHIAAYEDLWLVHRHGGEPLLRPDLADLYDAFETPRAVRGDIQFLDRRRGASATSRPSASARWRCSRRDGHGDGLLHEMVLRHEPQHNETMRQTLVLAGLLGGAPASGRGRLAAAAGEEWADVPAGPFRLGRRRGGLRLRQRAARATASRSPPSRSRADRVTNGTWMHFSEGGGYERREWWSDEGWAWKEEYDITHPEGWTADGAARLRHRPVVHVSWFEADAFARAHGARLPTEAEWEKAATWDQGIASTADRARSGNGRPRRFGGYPGFVAHPYPEYSEVFFGDGYRVLRGGSWATAARVRRATFRNWDLPQRRQIFAGVRLATGRDLMEPILEARRRGATPTWARATSAALADDVLDGLTRPFKELPPKHLYDARGSELFDAICELPEYYQTRTERPILETAAEEVVAPHRRRRARRARLGGGDQDPRAARCDGGRGDARPLRPVDVTESTRARLRRRRCSGEYPGLRVHGLVGDFERHLVHLPPPDRPAPVAFLGGTIGNFPPGSRRRFLRGLAEVLGPEGHLLLGTDLVKDPAVIEAAYDDAAGVTAEFNRNVLHVVNRELGADFDVGRLRARRVLRPPPGVDRDAPARDRAAARQRRRPRPAGRFRRARGDPHGDQREVHAAAPGGRSRGGRAGARRALHRPRRPVRAVAVARRTPDRFPP